MKTAVVGLSPYLDRNDYQSLGLEVFKDPYAFMREGLMRNFTPNLSNIAVVTCLRELGYDAEQVDTTLEFGLAFSSESRQSWLTRIKTYFASKHFDNVFISCVSASEHLNLRLVSDTIRQASPECIIGVGSYHANTLREQLLKEMPALDFIFLGDIEGSAKTLMDRLSGQQLADLASMDNVIVRTDLDSNVAARKKPDHQSSASHFSYRLCDKYLAYYDSMASVGMKGCPYTCSFCQEKIVRPGYQSRDPVAVVAEAVDNYEHYKEKLGHNRVGYGFMDPIFGLDKSWNKGFVEAVAESGLEFYWGAQTRVGQLNAETLKSMAAAGCRIIYYGLENYSPKMLIKMGKARHPEKYLSDFARDIANCQQAGILVETNILFGYPGESEETLCENEMGIRETLACYPNSSVNLNIFRPLPGTKGLSEAMLDDGAQLLVDDWWTQPLVPGLTVMVQPSAEVGGTRLMDFYASIYGQANTYKRRGVNAALVAMFEKGELSCDDLTAVSQMIRDKLWQMTGLEA